MPLPSPYMLRRHASVATLLLCPALLCACDGSLVVDITDAPIDDAERVVLEVPAIELLDSDGATVTVDTDNADSFDLLDYQDGNTLRLVSENFDESTHFLGIRPRFDDGDAYVRTSSGGHVPIEIIGKGDFATLAFTLESEQSTAIVIDLDLRFSLIDRVDDLGVYEMLPVVRAIDADTAGRLAGSVDTAILTDDSCRGDRSTGDGVAVYLYDGSDVTPVDYVNDGSVVASDPPIASAGVRYDGDSGTWGYRFDYVTPGDYTVALTCEADDENPLSDDDLDFWSSANATVTEAGTTTLNFE